MSHDTGLFICLIGSAALKKRDISMPLVRFSDCNRDPVACIRIVYRFKAVIFQQIISELQDLVGHLDCASVLRQLIVVDDSMECQVIKHKYRSFMGIIYEVFQISLIL